MNRRQLVLHLRKAIEAALPGVSEKTVRRMFCRMCALRYAQASGFAAEGGALYDGEPIPDALLPAMAYLRDIPDEEWQGHPELCGWLYQYYNLPEREAAFSGLRDNVKIPPERIPAATQLFTPDWIVQYMVQNALGTVCHPLPEWKYYIAPEENCRPLSPQATLGDERRQQPAAGKSVAEIRVIDPCMGTGHILAYVFDALMALYLAEGYAPGKAAELILTRNLYGLDIDDTAVQLSEFVLRMKAAVYLPEVLYQRPQMHLYSFAGEGGDAEVFGSLLRPEQCSGVLSEVLQERYDAVITNPPYMGSSGMSEMLSEFVKQQYPAGKYDLFAAFMVRCAELTAEDGCFSMITQHAWMFLSRYRRLRKLMRRHSLLNMVHLGPKAFPLTDVGTIVQTTAFTALGREINNFPAVYIRLTEQEDKEAAFSDPALRYVCTPERFSEIPGKPLCYWISDRMLEILHAPKLGEFCKICQGMTTSDNKRFLRRWYEVAPGSIPFGCRNAAEAAATGKMWFPYNKGGRLRRWYGNHSWVVNYRNDGEELRAFHAVLNLTHSGGRLKNADMYFHPALTWPFITESTRFGVRVQPEGFLFDVSGSCLFPEEGEALYLAGFLASSAALEFLKLSNPTMNFQAENLRSLPVIFDRSRQPEIESLVQENIRLAREDWDSSEESWDFTVHPLVRYGAKRLEEAFRAYQNDCERRIDAMQCNEEKLNRIFAEIYGLTEELDCRAPETTLRRFDAREAAEDLVSFAVGCLFGRYTLPGVPVLEENYLPLHTFPAYLETFLEAVYGTEQLAENVRFLEEMLGCTLSRYGSAEFYTAHCRKFRKRPLYWLATSGRKHAVYGLCYFHRMGESPVPMLLRLTGKLPPCAEGLSYRDCLTALKGVRIDPDAGIPENHRRFRSAFAAIR